MKELKFRYTNHEWYSLVRSFLILIGVILIVSAIDFALLSLPFDWHATSGSVIRSIGLVIGAICGGYIGFKIARRLFDREGSVTLTDKEVIVKLGKKEWNFEINDISEVYGDTFAKFDGLRFRDAKAFGPLYTKHAIVTARGEFFVTSSIEEGWVKAGSSIWGKDNPIPEYSLDVAFDEVRDYVEEVKGRGKEADSESGEA